MSSSSHDHECRLNTYRGWPPQGEGSNAVIYRREADAFYASPIAERGGGGRIPWQGCPLLSWIRSSRYTTIANNWASERWRREVSIEQNIDRSLSRSAQWQDIDKKYYVSPELFIIHSIIAKRCRRRSMATRGGVMRRAFSPIDVIRSKLTHGSIETAARRPRHRATDRTP